jgi:ferredoxin
MGNCTTCQHPLVSGEIEYPFGHTGEPDAGHILLCCSKPKGDSDLTIDA